MAYLAHSKRTLELLRKQDKSFYVLHFFYDYRAGSGLANNVVGMLRMFLYQLTRKFTNIKTRLEQVTQNEELDFSSSESLLHVMCETLATSDLRICAFIDGLDEYKGNYVELLQSCQILLDRTSIKLCVASRPEAEVSKVLKTAPEIYLQDYNRASMDSYYTGKVAQLTVDNIDAASLFNDVVRNELINRAEGVILWFRLAWDEITRAFTPDWTEDQLYDFIEALPIGLDAMYQRILSSIPPLHRQEAAIILHIYDKFQQLSEAGFKTTELEYLLGAYHFLADMDDIGLKLSKLDSCTDFVIRVKTLLRGLLEFFQVSRDSRDVRLGPSEMDTRLIHKTLSSYLSEVMWVSQNLPVSFQNKFPDSFCFRLYSTLISAAAADGLLSNAQVKRMQQELCAVAPILDISYTQRKLRGGLMVTKYLFYTLIQARYLSLGVLKEFWPRLLTITYKRADDDRIESIEHHLQDFAMRSIFSLTRQYCLPPKWIPRRELLRSAFGATLALANDYGNVASCTSLLAPALHSNMTILFCLLDKREDSLHDYIAASMARDPDLLAIADLVLAVGAGLFSYYTDTCYSRPLSRKQLEFLVSTVLVQGTVDLSTTIQFIEVLMSRGASLTARHVCEILQFSEVSSCKYGNMISIPRRFRSMADMGRLVAACAKHQDSSVESAGHSRLCSNLAGKGNLLLDWVEHLPMMRSALDDLTTKERTRLYTDNVAALRLILAYGIDLNLPCYEGGDVLLALLDPAIVKARKRGYFRARFIALVECDFRPSSAASLYINAAEKAYGKIGRPANDDIRKRECRITIDGIIASVCHYMENDSWPAVNDLLADDFWERHASVSVSIGNCNKALKQDSETITSTARERALASHRPKPTLVAISA